MFFLLPPKPISDPIVTNFRQSLAQSNENNYHNIPLYNLRGGQQENNETMMQTEARNEPKPVSKTPMPRKSNVATKSKPMAPIIASTPAIPPKCRNCNWTFPESMTNEDRDLHGSRCRAGYGEEDQMVWMRYKGDRNDYRYNTIQALYNCNRKKFEDFIQKAAKERDAADKPEKMEKEKPGKGAGKKSVNKMEVEDNDDAIKIKKKSKAIKETKETRPATAPTPETKKRKTAGQSQRDEDEEDIMIKGDLKKIKKNNEEGANSKVSEIEALSGKVRKSATNKVSLPVASGLVFDPTQAFNKFSGEKK